MAAANTQGSTMNLAHSAILTKAKASGSKPMFASPVGNDEAKVSEN